MGEFVDPTDELLATEEVNQLLRVTKRAILNSGDHLYFQGNHYGVSAYSKEVLDTIYRLIPFPDIVSWQVQQVLVEDPLTGLSKPVSAVAPPVQTLHCKKKTESFEGDIHSNMKPKACYLMTEVVSVGDLLDGFPVKRIYKEQDIYKVET
jgi:hypothetical protein